jgi:threonine dehydrogenase-like Zn-dependent dehydrogenase
LHWAAQTVAKAGSIGIIGVFPPRAMTFPVGALQQRNVTIKGGNCNHRKYIPKLVGLVASGTLDPTEILTQQEPVTGAIAAYKAFDRLSPGWIMVELEPSAS